METLKVLLGAFLKIVGAFLLVAIYLVALEYYHSAGRADRLLSQGYFHLYEVWGGSFGVFCVTFAPAISFWVLARASSFLRLSLLGRMFSGLQFVVLVGAIAVNVVGFGHVYLVEFLRVMPVMQFIAINLVVLVGAYVGYFIAAVLVDRIGRQFEMLADALPKGRAVMFSEALSAGYNKPQIMTFINELSISETSINYTHTTFFLYVVPFVTFIGMLVKVVFFA